MPSAALSSHPSRDRPRERLASHGAATLSDVELVAIQLGSGSRGRTALQLAADLLAEFGGPGGLSRAGLDELARYTGVGPAKASRIVSAFALGDRSRLPTSDRPQLRTSADIAAIAGPRISRARTEQVLLLVADGAHRLTRVITVATGGATSSALPVREVLALALRHDAVAFAVSHNHPSGAVEPSAADLTVTRRLREAADQVGLRLLDHVIVAGDRWCSVTASR